MLHLIRVDPHHPGSLDPEDILGEFESFIYWPAPSSGKSRLTEWELYNSGPARGKKPYAKWLLEKFGYFLRDEPDATSPIFRSLDPARRGENRPGRSRVRL
jgi:hypothetical protein